MPMTAKPAELERSARFTALLEASEYRFDEVERLRQQGKRGLAVQALSKFSEEEIHGLSSHSSTRPSGRGGTPKCQPGPGKAGVVGQPVPLDRFSSLIVRGAVQPHLRNLAAARFQETHRCLDARQRRAPPVIWVIASPYPVGTSSAISPRTSIKWPASWKKAKKNCGRGTPCWSRGWPNAPLICNART
jgi:hypothetical protein